MNNNIRVVTLQFPNGTRAIVRTYERVVFVPSTEQVVEIQLFPYQVAIEHNPPEGLREYFVGLRTTIVKAIFT